MADCDCRRPGLTHTSGEPGCIEAPTAAGPDPRFRDQLAEALKAHTVVAFAGCDSMCACDRKWRTNIAYREHLAAEVAARVQAAANQRAAEAAADPDDDFWQVTVEIPRAATDAEADRIFDAVADAAYDAQPEARGWDIFVHGRGPRPLVGALASPAPAPHAEEDFCVHGHATDDAHVCGAPR